MAVAKKPAPTVQPPREAIDLSKCPPAGDLGQYPQGVVGIVGRNVDGSPHLPPGFKVVVPHDATEDELRAAWNHPDGDLPPQDVLVTFYRAERRRPQV